MKPIFTAAKAAEKKRVIFSEGEDERVLRAAQVLIEEGIAEPILIGRPQIIETRLQRYGLRIRPLADFAVINPEDDPRFREYVDLYLSLVGRRGVKGGETRVFDARGPQGMRFTLSEPWSVLLLDDERVIHETTPIQPADAQDPGHRDTLVLTFRRDGFQGPTA